MSGAVVLKEPDYGGRDETTAQVELPASDTAPYSYRETKGRMTNSHTQLFSNPAAKDAK